MNPMISQAVANALMEQPWFIRRKDTIAAVAGTTLQMVNILAAQTTEWPAGIAVVIAVIVGVLQVIVHAATVGAITPSMEQRLVEAAPEVPQTVTDPVEAARNEVAVAEPVGLGQ